MPTTPERIILDPLSEDPANAPLEITGIEAGHGIFLISHSYPKAERKTAWASNRSTRGERKVAPGLPGARVLPLRVWVAEEEGIGAATNLATNPSAEVATTSFTQEVSATLSRVTTQRRRGESSLQVVTGNTAAFEGVYAGAYDVTASRTYTGAIDVRAPAGTTLAVVLKERTAADAAVGQTLVQFTATGEWQRVSASRVFGATGVKARLSVITMAQQALTFHVDGVLLVEQIAGQPIDYFDGDTPGCAWTGTRNASTSTRRGASGKRFLAALNDLEAKIEKFAREKGTYKRILPSGDEITFDVQDASIDGNTERPFSQGRQGIDLELAVEPLGRGPEFALGTEKTVTGAPASAPALVAIDTATVKGTAGARGRLLVDNDVAADQAFLAWGIESRYFDTADPATKKLILEAEDLTALGTSTKVAGPTGASGPGANKVVRQTDLSPTAVAILSTQLTAGSAHLQHVGTYRVWARVYRPTTNTGEVAAWLEWSTGDFGVYTPNRAQRWAADEAEGRFTLVSLGLVKIEPAAVGAQRWEGRVIATSTVAGDEIDVDYLWLQPVAEGAGRAVAPAVSAAPPSISARDEFDHAQGTPLTGKALPVGGTWALVTGSNGTDFILTTPTGQVQRTAVSDADLNTGRYVSAGAINYGGVCVSTRAVSRSGLSSIADTWRNGVFARLVDINNWLMLVISDFTGGATNEFAGYTVSVLKRTTAGGVSVLASGEIGFRDLATLDGLPVDLKLTVKADGGFVAEATMAGDTVILTGFDADLLTGGALASGRVGIYDSYTVATAATRVFDNFKVTPITNPAAVHASQSAEIRHNIALREDAAGAFWPRLPGYRGDYLYLPPSGRERRQLRWTVKLARLDPAIADPNLDALSAQLYVTPLYDVVPEPS